ncbi:PspC domain-containing protein [Permianibacter aggregans]|uniref:Phage shock protein C (PspC) family protein n=1 Tax=Permianibacter aggregans TaxID=1510150 RepID=A0A4V3D7M1_9GAMM|nr:PspC domain-containing protein [Permianibacter aggregans]QGX40805.1 PspC domain-containing protein [Permianibacter aggregans]TDQ48377.1 phage shock protein C (PspC) family protein [Permianibacter aggregans]
MARCSQCGRPLPKGDTAYRVKQGRKLFGVCAGIADHFGFSRFAVRLIALMALVFLFPAALIAYFLAALLMDEEPEYIEHVVHQ